MSKSNESNATAYIDAWSRKDLDGIAAHLHPAVHFKGPMQELNGRDAVFAATFVLVGVVVASVPTGKAAFGRTNKYHTRSPTITRTKRRAKRISRFV